MYKFVLNEPPIAKARPRFYVRGKKIGVYDCQKDDTARLRLSIHSQMAMNALYKPVTGPVHVRVCFHTAIPKSWSQKRLKSVLEKSELERWNITRPDIDNYIKFFLDLMNGIVYVDDAQIVSSQAYKIYSDRPRTEIEVTKLKE